jgi:hypothetical protein
MKKFNLRPEMSVNDLIEHGIPVELDPTNTIMRLSISDKDLTKFKCNLLEEDYPNEFPETYSILELNLKHFCQRATESGDWSEEMISKNQLLELLHAKINTKKLRT